MGAPSHRPLIETAFHRWIPSHVAEAGGLFVNVPSGLLSALTGIDPVVISLAVFVNATGIWLRAEAWRGLVRHACGGRPVRSRDAFHAYVVGLVGNAFLPARAGEAARVGVLARGVDADGAYARVAGTAVAHRIIDAIPFALLVLLATASGGTPVLGGVATAAVVVGCVVAVAAVVVLARRPARNGIAGGRVAGWLRALRGGVTGLGDPRTAARALALETAAWAAQLAVVWLTLDAFGLPTTLAAAALTLVAVNVAVALPLVPGGVGLFQAATALSLGAGGVAAAAGVAFGVGLQALELLTTVLVGLPVLAHGGIVLTRGRAWPFRGRVAGSARARAGR